jgi:hypothetical protein
MYMKKIINYLLIAATVCGISLAAVSCSKDDDNDIVPPVEEPDDNGANSGDDDGGLSINNQSGNGGSNELEPRTCGAEW